MNPELYSLASEPEFDPVASSTSLSFRHSLHAQGPGKGESAIELQPAGPLSENGERNSSNNANGNDNDATTYPTPVALTFLMLGICLAAALVALDRTIIATAIPRITDEFDSLQDVGWYGSAYLLSSCGFQPTYGKIFSLFDVRISFVVTLAFFELGSLICGIAPNSVVLIVGRAIAGLGCAGIFAGCMVIIAVSVPLAKRPAYMALVGAIFGTGSVAGPLLGGVFTDRATWRWCFYFNLPVGAVTLVTLLLFFHPAKTDRVRDSFLKRIFQLDLLGNLLIIASIVMILLALQLGGISAPWNSSEIIGLFVGGGLGLVAFIAWQLHRGDEALIPPNILATRTVAFACISGFFLSGAFIIHSYYLPYWYQAVQNVSAIQSGIDVVPYMVSQFGLSIVAAIAVTKIGYFTLPAILGPALAAVGCGLLTTVQVSTPNGTVIGYQVVAAAGVGIAFQQGLVAVQAILPKDLLPIGTALTIFAQSLSAAIFVSVGDSVLENEFSSGLISANLPGVNVREVLQNGVTEIRSIVPPSQLEAVLMLYNSALTKVFLVAVPLAAISFLTALPMKWIDIRGKGGITVGEV